MFAALHNTDYMNGQRKVKPFLPQRTNYLGENVRYGLVR